MLIRLIFLAALVALALGGAAFALLGFDDGAVEVAGPANGAARAPEPVSADWLKPDDDRDPGAWLAEVDGGAPPSPAEALVYSTLLTRIDAFYHETPRMIANRVAQLHRELREEDGSLTVRRLLTDFSWPAGNARDQTLGEVAQHYLVLRRNGEAHEAAMREIRTAYGAPDD